MSVHGLRAKSIGKNSNYLLNKTILNDFLPVFEVQQHNDAFISAAKGAFAVAPLPRAQSSASRKALDGAIRQLCWDTLYLPCFRAAKAAVPSKLRRQASARPQWTGSKSSIRKLGIYQTWASALTQNQLTK